MLAREQIMVKQLRWARRALGRLRLLLARAVRPLVELGELSPASTAFPALFASPREPPGGR
jgi:hypothetical protein